MGKQLVWSCPKVTKCVPLAQKLWRWHFTYTKVSNISISINWSWLCWRKSSGCNPDGFQDLIQGIGHKSVSVKNPVRFNRKSMLYTTLQTPSFQCVNNGRKQAHTKTQTFISIEINLHNLNLPATSKNISFSSVLAGKQTRARSLI